MGFTEHLGFVQILWTFSVMEHITSGFSFSSWDNLCDYAKELCEILVGAASYRKSEQQYGERDGIKWNACLFCMKRSIFLYLIGCVLTLLTIQFKMKRIILYVNKPQKSI